MNKRTLSFQLLFSALLPATFSLAQSWSAKTPFGGSAREGSVGFSIGTKGYMASGYDGARKQDLWEYDQAGNSWMQKNSFTNPGRNASSAFVIGTKAYVGGGISGLNPDAVFMEWDQGSNAWSTKTSFGGGGRELMASFAIGTKGYFATGYDFANGAYNDLWEWNQGTNGWTQKNSLPGSIRHSGIGFSIGTKGYVGLGNDDGMPITFLNDLWEWDQGGNSWSAKTSLPAAGRWGAVAFTIGTKAYVGTGGVGASTYTTEFWEWSQTGNSWTQLANFGGSARHSAAGFSIGTCGYIGTGNDGAYKQDFYEYCTAALPVSVYSFDAACAGNNEVNVSWETASGKNNDYYVLERSYDDMYWEPLTRIKVAGNSQGRNTYEYTDHPGAASSGRETIYYRLQETAYSGQYQYFGPVTASCAASGSPVVVWPSSGNGVFTVTTRSFRIRSVELFDMFGRKLEILPAPLGQEQFMLDLGSHGSGVYYLCLKGAEASVARKILISR